MVCNTLTKGCSSSRSHATFRVTGDLARLARGPAEATALVGAVGEQRGEHAGIVDIDVRPPLVGGTVDQHHDEGKHWMTLRQRTGHPHAMRCSHVLWRNN